MRPTLRRAILLMAVMLGLHAAPALAADCNCPSVGDYVSPASAVPRVTSAGESPGGRYTIAASGSSQITLTIRRKSTNAVVWSSTVPGSSGWGFSPDQDRFVYHYVNGSVHNYVLIDLTRSSSQQISSSAVAMWSGAPGGTARLVFSPNGRYLMHAVRTGQTSVSMRVVDATTGQARHDTTLIISPTPGSRGDSYGMAHWGFSPDPENRTLAYGYVTGQNSVLWNVVNLAAGQVVRSQNVLAISAFWQFSPCGDAIGIVEQNSPDFLDVSLYRTSTGATMGSLGGLGFGSAALSSTLAQHQVTINGQTTRIAENTADAPCPAATAVDTLTVAPASVVGGAGNATGTVRLNRAPTGSFTVNLSSSDTSAATVPATLTLTSQQRTFTVTSRAVSAARSVTITATGGGQTRTASLTVQPPAPAATVADLSFSPASVQGRRRLDRHRDAQRPRSLGRRDRRPAEPQPGGDRAAVRDARRRPHVHDVRDRHVARHVLHAGPDPRHAGIEHAHARARRDRHAVGRRRRGAARRRMPGQRPGAQRRRLELPAGAAVRAELLRRRVRLAVRQQQRQRHARHVARRVHAV